MILLDTHAFLWFLTDDSRLPAKIKDKISAETAPTGTQNHLAFF